MSHRLHPIHQPSGTVHPKSGNRVGCTEELPDQGGGRGWEEWHVPEEHLEGDHLDKQGSGEGEYWLD